MGYYGLAERWISQNRKQGLSFAFIIRKRSVRGRGRVTETHKRDRRGRKTDERSIDEKREREVDIGERKVKREGEG